MAEGKKYAVAQAADVAQPGPHRQEANPNGAHTIQIDEDYHAWLLDQAASLRAQQYLSLDPTHLAEELEAMAAAERREMKKQLKRLLAHLLKLRAQPKELHRHEGWRRSIRDAREQIDDLLEESPGLLQGKQDEVVSVCYQRARVQAADEAHLPLNTFPEKCPWTLVQARDEHYFPGPAVKHRQSR